MVREGRARVREKEIKKRGVDDVAVCTVDVVPRACGSVAGPRDPSLHVGAALNDGLRAGGSASGGPRASCSHGVETQRTLGGGPHLLPRTRGLRQVEAAQLLGGTQPRALGVAALRRVGKRRHRARV